MASTPGWTEDDSALFIGEGRYFVPEREAILATMCGLVPGPPEATGAPFELVDLCCGEGLLARALLESFPGATVRAFDGSPAMLKQAAATAGPHRDRLILSSFDLADPAWRRFPVPPNAVLSSLAVHHLDADQKRALFRDMLAVLAPGGALILCDLVRPQSPLGLEVAAAGWDEAVRRRSLELDGDLDAFLRFQASNWNLYRDPEPDPIDQPSPLYDQLRWLAEAGYDAVDVHWMLGGHVVYGGRKPA